MQKWEYLTQSIELPNRTTSGVSSIFSLLGNVLNEFGQQGWEVVSLWRSSRKAAYYRVVFKRPVE